MDLGLDLASELADLRFAPATSDWDGYERLRRRALDTRFPLRS